MTAKVILNPYSARWQARERWPEAEGALKAVGVDFDLAVSEGRGHCADLAEQAVKDGFSPIIAAGGDGTIGEVVNGLARAARSEDEPLGPFGVMPLGTANDLMGNLNMSTELTAAARTIASGHIRPVDLCKVNDRYFVNNSALGLEPLVTVIQQEIVWVKGIFRYLLAALTAIARGPRWDVEMEWDDGQYNGPISLVTVGNGALTGGLFYMTPHADPFDGKLTFTYGYRRKRLAMLGVLPRAMKPGEGSYVEMDGIHEINTTRLHVRLLQPTPAHADGELFSEAIQDVTYSIFPGRLQFLMPV
ncbi:MAG: diacylglycerol kinase family lipid kinase [Chloroflexi bacterium]|nr:diacylglycerol kinase family lipid kinase [Chloroflexota bacterium]